MAFNPFDVFRRNQRILFAALTVVIMFMFVLSFGQGDIFTHIPQWVASKQRTGETVAELGREKIRQSQIADIEARRVIANQYMTNAALLARQNLRQTAQDLLPKVTAANSVVVQEAVAALDPQYISQQLMNQAQMARFGAGAMPTNYDVAVARATTLDQAGAKLVDIAQKSTNSDDQTAALAALRGVQIDQRLRKAGSTQRDVPQYFWAQPAGTARDAVDFLVWLRKADDLGIQFTDDDVVSLANKEFFNALETADWAAVEKAIALRDVSLARNLLGALADEFRVRAAIGAVLGQDYLNPNGRLHAPPADFFRFYKEQVSPATFGVISVPAANFISQVTATPTEAELRAVFNQAKSNDAIPSDPRIGLREPRRVKVGFMTVSGDDPQALALGAEATAQLGAMSRIGGLLAAPLVLPWANLAGVPAAAIDNPALDQAYADYVTRFRQDVQFYWAGGAGTNRVIDSHLATPASVAIVIGSAGLAPLSTTLAVVGGAVQADQQARLGTLPPTLFVPDLSAGSGLTALVAAIAPQIAATPPVARAALEPKLVEEFQKKLARDITLANIKTLQDELAKLKPKSDDAAAQKLIAEFAERHGASVQGSQEFRDLYTLADDPGLAPLVAKVDTPSPFETPLPAVERARRFGLQLTAEVDSTVNRFVPAMSLFKPVPLPPPPAFLGGQISLPVTLAWRSADQPAEPLRDFNLPTTRAKVEAAWKRLEARKLARQAAEQLRTQTQNLGTQVIEIDQKLRDVQARFAQQFPDPAAQARVNYFQIEDVAPIVKQALPGQDAVGPFTLTPNDNIPYPTQAMREKLLEAKSLPPSSSVVLTDDPEETHYVAVLLYRTDRDAGNFAVDAYGSLADISQLSRPVRQLHQESLRQSMREQAVAFLKAEYGYRNETAALDPKPRGANE